MTLVVIQTGDGSRTLIDTERNIHYRSLQGARSEADQIFVSASRIAGYPAPRILELGLGTGLNFLASAEALLNQGASLEYHAVEASPLPAEVFRSLEQNLKYPWLTDLVAEALEAVTARPVATVARGGISLTIYASSWQDTSLPEGLTVEAIYHDPFGPKENPEAWTQACFAWSSRHLTEMGRLVTYGAATPVRKAMVAAGLQIGSLKGSGSKREMTVAVRDPAALADARILPLAKYQ